MDKENRIRIGRASHNEIVLDSPYIADEAAVLHKRGRAWELLVLGINGGQRVTWLPTP